MDIISLIWTLAAILIFGTYLLVVIPYHTLFIVLLVSGIAITAKFSTPKKEKKNENDKK